METRPEQAMANVVAKTSAASSAGMAARTQARDGVIQSWVSQVPGSTSAGWAPAATAASMASA